MSSFTRPLILMYDSENNTWKTTREFSYHVGLEESDDIITVPAGFETDLASIPPIAEMFIPKSGVYNQAAVLHDFLYSTMTRTRKESDKIFLEAMKVLGVPWFKRHLMYRAVRLNVFKKWEKKF